MQYQDNEYLDLTTYPDIYRELVYQRNSTIHWLDSHNLLGRNRHVTKSDAQEWDWQSTARTYRPVFRTSILQILDRLHSHDAIEAIYDFNAIDLVDWSDTEANRLERELQQLQLIITKLEVRYRLQYKLVFEYDHKTATLYLNRTDVLKYGQNSIKHRLLTTLFTKPNKQWTNEDIADYFVKKFHYQQDELSDASITKAANDIKRDVALKAAAKDFLIVSNASVHINPHYIT